MVKLFDNIKKNIKSLEGDFFDCNQCMREGRPNIKVKRSEADIHVLKEHWKIATR